MIGTLAISGYRSLRDLVLPLDRLNLVTGPNGSGKSSLYRALRLLGDAALNSVVSSLAREGGLPSTLWAGPETISRFQDGDQDLVTLDFRTAISGTGTYFPDRAIFEDSTAGAIESAFDGVTLTASSNGLSDVLSTFGCLSTGSGCRVGNALNVTFEIPAAMLNAVNVPAIELDQPHPLDLFEDDGITEVQASITTYSYSPVPEPRAPLLLATGIAVLAAKISVRKP